MWPRAIIFSRRPVAPRRGNSSRRASSSATCPAVSARTDRASERSSQTSASNPPWRYLHSQLAIVPGLNRTSPPPGSGTSLSETDL